MTIYLIVNSYLLLAVLFLMFDWQATQPVSWTTNFPCLCFLPTFITWQYPKPSECEAYYTKHHFCTSLNTVISLQLGRSPVCDPIFLLSSQMPVLLPPLPVSWSQGRCVMTNSLTPEESEQEVKSAALDFFPFCCADRNRYNNTFLNGYKEINFMHKPLWNYNKNDTNRFK